MFLHKRSISYREEECQHNHRARTVQYRSRQSNMPHMLQPKGISIKEPRTTSQSRHMRRCHRRLMRHTTIHQVRRSKHLLMRRLPTEATRAYQRLHRGRINNTMQHSRKVQLVPSRRSQVTVRRRQRNKQRRQRHKRRYIQRWKMYR